MNITIVGAGNIGTQFAVHCAEKGHNVIVYGSKPEKVNKYLTIINEKDEVIHQGEIILSTNDPQEAFTNADFVFVTMPAFCMEKISEIVSPFASSKMTVCLVPGTGGGECAFKKCLNKGATICGLQRVPSVARLVEYGKILKATGYRDELFVAALPHIETNNCARIIGSIFDIKCSALPCYLNLTLTPSNPILHTTRLKTIFEDYKPGVFYDSVPLFYEGWTDESSELLFNCDNEVQEICKKLNQFDLSYVKSLKLHYESPTPVALTQKIKSILGFKGLPSPIVSTEQGIIPDLNSRYFTADFPFGLAILIQIADYIGVNVPNMKETMNWYNNMVKPENVFSYESFGITNYNEFIEFYSL